MQELKREGGKELKNYTLTASLNGSMTSIPIRARNAFMAKTLAVIEVSKKQAADKRWDKGEIVLKSPESKQIMIIKVEE